MSQLGPEPSPERNALIADLLRMARIALMQRRMMGEIATGWGSVIIGDLVISGLPPDDVEIRIVINGSDDEMSMVFASVYGGTSVGTKANMERALQILQSHMILDELSGI
jgi:hypothetical protein